MAMALARSSNIHRTASPSSFAPALRFSTRSIASERSLSVIGRAPCPVADEVAEDAAEPMARQQRAQREALCGFESVQLQLR